MKFKKTVPLVISIVIMISLIAVSSMIKGNSPKVSENAVSTAKTELATADTATNVNGEMRGVWVSYMELTMENESDKSEISFRNKFEKIVKQSKGFGFNTLVVQVRPFCDALYKSSYFPYSHILTGEQGKNPNYDALKIMCEICRKYGLYIHAWVNPYRISTNNTPQKLAQNNPYMQDKSIGLKAENGLYLDPSSEKVRELIINGVVEIAKNYDVDGIQFDDYFYPTQEEAFDDASYNEYVNKYGENKSMSRDNWRLANVNMLVCQTYRALHRVSDKIVFGISPQGNLANNDNLYADVKTWSCCRGFVDYICPQIYFSPDNPALGFEKALNEWTELDLAENVKLYVGLAGYKAGGDADSGTWLDKEDILATEYNIISDNSKVSGFMLYSYASLNNSNATAELKNLKNALN